MKNQAKYFFILALLLVMMYLIKPIYVLAIKDVKEDSILFTSRVRPGFEFATLIRHSVQKTPVYEYYRVEKDATLTVVRTKLQDIGWGMPSTSDYKVVFKDDYMIMDEINRNLSFLPFRVNYIAEPHLIIRDKKIDLRQHVEDNQAIHVYIQKMRNVNFIVGGEINAF